MKAVTVFFAIILYAGAANAQAGITMDANSPGVGGYGNVSFTNAGTIGVKSTESIDDADVSGSPYFSEKWAKAVLILQNNQAIRVNKAKLNLYKNEVHYIDTMGFELVAVAGAVKKVFFFDNKDTTKVAAVFQQITGIDGGTGTAYIQVLNSGKAELLKLVKIVINNRGYDPTAGKNSYNFVPKTSWCLFNNGVVTPLKMLNGEEVVNVMNPSTEAKTWLLSNNNKLRNEKDVISFLDYYNGVK